MMKIECPKIIKSKKETIALFLIDSTKNLEVRSTAPSTDNTFINKNHTKYICNLRAFNNRCIQV